MIGRSARHSPLGHLSASEEKPAERAVKDAIQATRLTEVGQCEQRQVANPAPNPTIAAGRLGVATMRLNKGGSNHWQ